jgi:hypothetical protein
MAAAALSLSARAGAQYSQFDGWAVDGTTTTMPHLDVNLGLDARGVIVSRDVFDYALRLSWGRISNETSRGDTSTTDMLSYSGRASLLDNTVSPVTLTGFASRGESDFSTSTAADSFGRGIATTAGSTLLLKGPSVPTLTAAYTWSSAENEIVGQPLRESIQHSLATNLTFGTPAFQVDAGYYGELREGAWDTDNYSLHGVSMTARGRIGGNVLSLASASLFNLPNELVPGTFESRTTSFSALLNAGAAGNLRNFSYSYGHSLVESPGAPTGEVTRQGLRYEGDHFVTRTTFFTRWLVDASYAVTRCESAPATCRSLFLPSSFSEETEARTTGETLGASLWWRRVVPTSTLELNAGPRVSLLQSEIEERGQIPRRSESGGFGASAGARVTRPLGVHALQANWSASYGDDLFANAGWQFTQELGASLSGPAATARYNASLRASSFRTHNPVTGDGAGRSLEATGTLTMARLSLNGRASLSNGMLGATPQQFTSDGLLLPAPFDSTLIDASIGGQFKLYPGLSAALGFHLARSDIPGRPLLHEVAARGGMTYQYGALGMTLEDRVSRTETVGGWETANLVMFSVFRSVVW